MKRILLLLPTTSYRNNDFKEAAQKLGVKVVPVADYCHQLAPSWGMGPLMSVHFDDPEQAAETVLSNLVSKPDAVIAVDDAGLELASLLNQKLGLPGNPPGGIRQFRDKHAFRKLLKEQKLPYPAFHLLSTHVEPELFLESFGLMKPRDQKTPGLKFPLVIKSRRLSASRGVIRVNNPKEFIQATAQVRSIQGKADRDAEELGVVVENFIPGTEHALEGVLENGVVKVLALFDKPDPMDGPYFEETLYVTPSRLPENTQDQIRAQVEKMCRAAGIQTGPFHAEMRVNEEGVWLLEIAARSIGGLCGRVLRHGIGMSLEELILRNALGEPMPEQRETTASGVMMMPIPKRGIYHAVHHLDKAAEVPGISDIHMAVEPGQLIAPPPEGSSYLGFIFAQGSSASEVEQALRSAYQQLEFDIRTAVPAAAKMRSKHR